MITVDEAKNLVDQNVKTLEEIEIDLGEACDYILSRDVFATLDLPSFNQSAMDGYVIHVDKDISKGDVFEIKGEVQAGDTKEVILNKNEGHRIFTGAMVPDTGNVIVIQEHVERTGDQIKVTRDVALMSNIRRQGEQIKKGTLALAAGTKISSGALSFLASFGLAKVPVYRKPTVGIVLTGNELVAPGNDLKKGQIYESNSFALKSAVEKAGYKVSSVTKVRDTYEETFDELKRVFENVDLLLVSGGISVGDYDFVGKALRNNGLEEIFYKVKQKPGKPLFFGRKESKFVFALPGNPASALVCFYQYGLPTLNKLKGDSFSGLTFTQKKIKNELYKAGDRAVYFKARFEGDEVEILDGQLSHMMHTFAISNCLVYIPWDVNKIEKGSSVQTYLLP